MPTGKKGLSMRLVLLSVCLVTLVCALMLPVVAAYSAVYVTIAGLAVLAVATLARSARDALRPSVIALLSALGLLVASTLLAGPLTAENWLAPAVVALPLLAVGFLHLERVDPRLGRIEFLASLALAGVALGAIAGTIDVMTGDDLRAQVGNNPIHYGGLMVLLGYGALAGFLTGNATLWRYVFVLGPVLGIAGAMLSGSRGPFLAGAAIGVVVFPLILVWNWRDRIFAVSLLVCGAVGAAAFSVSPLGQRAVGGAFELLLGARAGDLALADVPRSQMLSAAWAAFLDSPIWGHGWSGMMPAAEAHFPADSIWLGFDNLHADVSNFAVLGGILGLFGYGLLIVAPLLAVKDLPAANRRPGLVLALTLSGGVAALGLTNAVFGVLPQTVLYTALLGWLLLLTRPPTDTQ